MVTPLLGIAFKSAEAAVDGAQVVILAAPDRLIGRLAAEISSLLAPGTMVMTPDAAAPFAGHLPDRHDLICFVDHPCHTPTFDDETTPEARGACDADADEGAMWTHLLRSDARYSRLRDGPSTPGPVRGAMR